MVYVEEDEDGGAIFLSSAGRRLGAGKVDDLWSYPRNNG